MKMCRQKDCSLLAFFRYTWAGQDESFCCVFCGIKVAQVADSIGYYVQMIPLTMDEMMADDPPANGQNGATP